MNYSILLILCISTILSGMEKDSAAPSTKSVEQFSVQDYATLCALQQIIVRILSSSLVKAPQDYHEISINPYDRQSHQGLFLCLYESFPHAILTPWGLCTFATFYRYKDNISWQEMLEYLGRTVELEHFKDGIVDDNGHMIGPIYKIKKAGNIVLPEAKKREEKKLIPPNDARHIWDAMCIKYANERKLIKEKSEQEIKDEIEEWERLMSIIKDQESPASSSSPALSEQVRWEEIMKNL